MGGGDEASTINSISARGALTNIESGDRSLQWVEAAYRAHDSVKNVALFEDQLGQLVALVISEQASESRVRHILDEIARNRSPGGTTIVDLVALQPGDQPASALYTVTGSPSRNLIWQFLIGSIETPTTAGCRLSPTCWCQPCYRAKGSKTCKHCDVDSCCGVPDAIPD